MNLNYKIVSVEFTKISYGIIPVSIDCDENDNELDIKTKALKKINELNEKQLEDKIQIIYEDSSKINYENFDKWEIKEDKRLF